MGMCSAAIVAWSGWSRGAAMAIGQGSLLICLLGLLAGDAEGGICLLMCWPLLDVLLLAGSVLGWVLAGGGERVRRTMLLFLLAALPMAAWQETQAGRPLLREVRSSIDIAAPPMVVWRHVVAFTDLPPPDGIFATGIACPLRARIAGSGVGAVRRCEFTTGDFIEPITAWEPGRRLAFDVSAQPPAMRELSPWPEVKAPHLDGYLESRRGEFHLIALPDGGTRLEGSTWYEVDIHPEIYWSLWAGAFIHAIHERVLRHIAGLAEADQAGRSGQPAG